MEITFNLHCVSSFAAVGGWLRHRALREPRFATVLKMLTRPFPIYEIGSELLFDVTKLSVLGIDNLMDVESRNREFNG
jgi:hypothetical protein